MLVISMLKHRSSIFNKMLRYYYDTRVNKLFVTSYFYIVNAPMTLEDYGFKSDVQQCTIHHKSIILPASSSSNRYENVTD
jgi:hypothetical protein